MIALLRLVGSKQIQSFGLPVLLSVDSILKQSCLSMGCFMDRLGDSGSKHFLNLLSESLLEMNRYGSAGCLFGCNGWIYMNMIWLTWELAYAFEEFWVLFLNLLLCLHDSDFLWCVFMQYFRFGSG